MVKIGLAIEELFQFNFKMFHKTNSKKPFKPLENSWLQVVELTLGGPNATTADWKSFNDQLQKNLFLNHKFFSMISKCTLQAIY